MKYRKYVLFTSIICLLIGYGIYYNLSKRPLASWHMVNVNFNKLTGDANLIVIKDQVILIDSGYKNEAAVSLVPYLRKLKIKQINHFFVSHPHQDHYEGIAALWEDNVKIDNLYAKIPPKHICDREIPWGCNYDHFQKFIAKSKKLGIKFHQPKAGFTLTLPNESKIQILHAQEDDLPNMKIDVNDLSLIMKWDINEYTVLFTGDLNYNLGSYLSSDSRMAADFLKIPHHGGRSIAPNSFYDTVSPDYVLVPGPKWIWCGERGLQTRKWVMTKKLPHWVNGLHGTVRVEFYKNGGKIVTQNNESCDNIKSNSNSLEHPYIFGKKQ